MTTAIEVVSGITLAYFLLVNAIYLGFTATAWRRLLAHQREAKTLPLDEVLSSPLTPGVSVLVPAYNEAAGIVVSVRSLLDLRYPRHEVVVVNDGSTDDTLQRLIDAFELEPVRKALRQDVACAPVKQVYGSRRYPNLWVVDKENGGGKADAINGCLVAASHEYVCAIDADAVLEPDALLQVARPILDDPEVVVATGGIVRVINGCVLRDGRVVEVGLPKSNLAAVQVLEYFRAFLVGRVGWSSVNALLIISGAFGLFRRSLVEEIGGWDQEMIGEDIELVVRMHRRMHELDQPYRIEFVPDPVCWTEVPETLRVLSRQRRRWQRGLGQTLWVHKKLILNPRFGTLGLVAVPYFLFFEFLSPIIELLGPPFVIVAFLLGRLSFTFFVAFLVVAVLLGFLLSIAALALEEINFRRHQRSRELARLVLLAAFENVGYRQINAFWRFVAYFDLMRGRSGWGDMQKKGLGVPSV